MKKKYGQPKHKDWRSRIFDNPKETATKIYSNRSRHYIQDRTDTYNKNGKNDKWNENNATTHDKKNTEQNKIPTQT